MACQYRSRGSSPARAVARRNQARTERKRPTARRSSRRTEHDAAGISSCGNRRQLLTPFERAQAHEQRVRYRFPSVGEFVARRRRIFEGGVVRASIGADRRRCMVVTAGPSVLEARHSIYWGKESATLLAAKISQLL